MNNMNDWNPNQIRHLEAWFTDSLPDVSGLEIVSIDARDDGSWRAFYKYESTVGRSIEYQGSDYFTGHPTENGFEDFQLKE